MKYIHLLAAAILALVLAGCTVSFDSGSQGGKDINAGTVDQQKSIAAAAYHVIDLLDQGRFDETWTNAGPVLKERTSREAFASGIKGFRESLGTPGHRMVKGFNFPRVLDGVHGDFGIIGIETDFANAKAVQEKLVFQKVDGQWQLIGYWLTRTTSLLQ